MSFPEDFTWGVASSSYQIEGAARTDGRGMSVWDEFSHRPEAIWHQHNGDVACDHYHRYKEDVALMAELGVKAYRFSLAWPRILPEGTGPINPKGIDFYNRLIDELLKYGIEPWITLFHWDFPLDLFHKGGWLNRESSNWFASYAKVACEAFSDRVSQWITLNEPQCYLGLGHAKSIHAPGIPYPRQFILQGIHHTLLAHGKAVQAMRASSKQDLTIGWSPVGWVTYPSDEESSEVVEAARTSMFATLASSPTWFMNNSWYSDPVILGKYPEQGWESFGRDVPRVQAEDMDIISQPIDFYGVNIYHGAPINLEVTVNRDHQVKTNQRPPGFPQTQMGWSVDPKVLYWGPKFLSERYNLPVHITENGIASMDWIHSDGAVHDSPRIDYLNRHLVQLHRAIEDGVDIRGYFQWSIMDNYEWEMGYSKRFGLVYVDYANLERTPKDSFYWYKDVISSNGQSLPRWDDVKNLR